MKQESFRAAVSALMRDSAVQTVARARSVAEHHHGPNLAQVLQPRSPAASHGKPRSAVESFQHDGECVCGLRRVGEGCGSVRTRDVTTRTIRLLGTNDAIAFWWWWPRHVASVVAIDEVRVRLSMQPAADRCKFCEASPEIQWLFSCLEHRRSIAFLPLWIACVCVRACVCVCVCLWSPRFSLIDALQGEKARLQ